MSIEEGIVMFDEVLKSLYEKNRKRRVKFVDGDYYDQCFFDQPELKVLYCGTCHEKKETWFYIPIKPYQGNEVAPKEERQLQFLVPVQCKCERNKKLKEEKQRKLNRKINENRLKCWGYMNSSGQWQRNNKMEQVVFEAYDINKHIKKAKSYFSTFLERQEEGKGIMFCGKAGAGKTIAAMCLANALLNSGVEVIFKQQFQIVGLNKFDDKKEIEELGSCKVLIIDDFNEEQLSEYGIMMLLNLFELRIKRGLITCFTSNIKKEALENPCNACKPLDERIVANCYIVEDSSHNYRVNSYE